jgi:hypothetical protein
MKKIALTILFVTMFLFGGDNITPKNITLGQEMDNDIGKMLGEQILPDMIEKSSFKDKKLSHEAIASGCKFGLAALGKSSRDCSATARKKCN